jgi:hypothetical protein
MILSGVSVSKHARIGWQPSDLLRAQTPWDWQQRDVLKERPRKRLRWAVQRINRAVPTPTVQAPDEWISGSVHELERLVALGVRAFLPEMWQGKEVTLTLNSQTSFARASWSASINYGRGPIPRPLRRLLNAFSRTHLYVGQRLRGAFDFAPLGVDFYPDTSLTSAHERSKLGFNFGNGCATK